jgi:hypothetical protein
MLSGNHQHVHAAIDTLSKLLSGRYQGEDMPPAFMPAVRLHVNLMHVSSSEAAGRRKATRAGDLLTCFISPHSLDASAADYRRRLAPASPLSLSLLPSYLTLPPCHLLACARSRSMQVLHCMSQGQVADVDQRVDESASSSLQMLETMEALLAQVRRGERARSGGIS